MSDFRFLPAVAASAAWALLATAPAHAAAVSGQGTWETTLQGRDLDGNAANGYEAYYDTALNITWLADANYAKSSGFSSDGYLNWSDANTWAVNLNVNGVTGWRLPTMVDTSAPGCNLAYSGTDCGYNSSPRTSELAHMYYVTLGNRAYYSATGSFQSDFGVKNPGPFKNFRSRLYWSGLEYARSTDTAWVFGTDTGVQANFNRYSGLGAWAVRSGDVAAVPEPEVYLLALAGWAVAGVAARMRRA